MNIATQVRIREVVVDITRNNEQITASFKEISETILEKRKGWNTRVVVSKFFFKVQPIEDVAFDTQMEEDDVELQICTAARLLGCHDDELGEESKEIAERAQAEYVEYLRNQQGPDQEGDETMVDQTTEKTPLEVPEFTARVWPEMYHQEGTKDGAQFAEDGHTLILTEPYEEPFRKAIIAQYPNAIQDKGQLQRSWYSYMCRKGAAIKTDEILLIDNQNRGPIYHIPDPERFDITPRSNHATFQKALDGKESGLKGKTRHKETDPPPPEVEVDKEEQVPKKSLNNEASELAAKVAPALYGILSTKRGARFDVDGTTVILRSSYQKPLKQAVMVTYPQAKLNNDRLSQIWQRSFVNTGLAVATGEVVGRKGTSGWDAEYKIFDPQDFDFGTPKANHPKTKAYLDGQEAKEKPVKKAVPQEEPVAQKTAVQVETPPAPTTPNDLLKQEEAQLSEYRELANRVNAQVSKLEQELDKAREQASQMERALELKEQMVAIFHGEPSPSENEDSSEPSEKENLLR